MSDQDKPADRRAVNVADLTEANGKTWRENNMELRHGIECGTLVEVKYDRWHGGGACEKVHARLWVVEHTRDCDGTPLYTLSTHNCPDLTQFANEQVARCVFDYRCGFAEEQLTPVEITNDLQLGHDALEWGEPEPPCEDRGMVNGVTSLGE